MICTGGFQTARAICEVIERGDCDAVSIARPLIANNDLVRFFERGEELPEEQALHLLQPLPAERPGESPRLLRAAPLRGRLRRDDEGVALRLPPPHLPLTGPGDKEACKRVQRMKRPLLGPGPLGELLEEQTPVEAELARAERRRLAVLGGALLGLLLWISGWRAWRR